MALSFPTSPTDGDYYSFNTRTWRWTGTQWELVHPVQLARIGDKLEVITPTSSTAVHLRTLTGRAAGALLMFILCLGAAAFGQTPTLSKIVVDTELSNGTRVSGQLIHDTGLSVVYDHADKTITVTSTGGDLGTGDVVGPASAADSRIAAFDGTTGKLIKDGGNTIAQVMDRANHTGTLPAAALPVPTATTLGGVKNNAGAGGQFVTGIDAGGGLTYDTPAGGGGGNAPLVLEFEVGSAPEGWTGGGGTWSGTLPEWVQVLDIYILASGSGGGSGRRGAAGSNRSGGAGGISGPQQHIINVPVSAFGRNLSIVVGAGGAGGAAQTTDDTVGNDGSNGANSSVTGNWTMVAVNVGGTTGRGGLLGTSTPNNPTGPQAGNTVNITGGGNGSSGNGGNQSLVATTHNFGGAGGGGVSTGDVSGVGGAYVNVSSGVIVINQFAVTLTTNNAPAGTNGVNGSSPHNLLIGIGGTGGGGNNAGPGGNGGNGYRGGGGGGGGGCTNGFNSGAGGNGGNGYVRIIAR